jgi:ATP-dependent DNA helicase RecQ
LAEIHNILKQYWGYDAFRPLQEDIIQSVLNGNDTLALLPTGGGKSICFQVPGMALEGICIVVSPLIALMKDQIANLRSRQISAAVVISGMSFREIDRVLDDCVLGKYKFLYLSPERLLTDIARARIKEMKVGLLAVDEAHCISQWGYDFRPPYTRIAELRELIPNTPVMALTATATPEVVIDIQQKLAFKKPNVFQKSFERKNLQYHIIYDEAKLNRLLQILQKTKGSSIVYMRNRRKTMEIAKFLNDNGVSADYYHAGLSPQERDNKQLRWIRNLTRVVVATNAFGMGIDKPDVRYVVHLEPPDSLEAYFQEAGRAGRDEQTAYGILIYHKADSKSLASKLADSYPPLKRLRQVYTAIFNFYNIGVGSGKNLSLVFDVDAICKRFEIKAMELINSIKFFEREGLLLIQEQGVLQSRIHILADNEEVYKLRLHNNTEAKILSVLLRSYGGLFEHHVKINENLLSQKLKIGRAEVVQSLNKLHADKMIEYLAQTHSPQLILLDNRIDERSLVISKEMYADRKAADEKRLDAVIRYCEAKLVCRSKILLEYFGEKEAPDCGQCDVCRKQKQAFDFDELEKVKNQIKQAFGASAIDVEQVYALFTKEQKNYVAEALKKLTEEDIISINNKGVVSVK